MRGLENSGRFFLSNYFWIKYSSSRPNEQVLSKWSDLEGSDWNLWFLYKKNFESECRSMWHPDEVKCIGIKLLTSFCSTHILFDPHLVRPTFWHFWTLDSNLFELWVLAGVRCLRVLVACVCSMLAGARCLRVRQHYQPRKVIKKNCM